MSLQCPLSGQEGESLRVSSAGELLLVVRLRLKPVFRAHSQASKLTPAALERLSELSEYPDEGVSIRAKLLPHAVRHGSQMAAVREFNTTGYVLRQLARNVLENGPEWLLRYRGKRLKTAGSET